MKNFSTIPDWSAIGGSGDVVEDDIDHICDGVIIQFLAKGFRLPDEGSFHERSLCIAMSMMRRGLKRLARKDVFFDIEESQGGRFDRLGPLRRS